MPNRHIEPTATAVKDIEPIGTSLQWIGVLLSVWWGTIRLITPAAAAAVLHPACAYCTSPTAPIVTARIKSDNQALPALRTVLNVR